MSGFGGKVAIVTGGGSGLGALHYAVNNDGIGVDRDSPARQLGPYRSHGGSHAYDH